MSGPPIVDWLHERSFGGREAVAVPGDRVAAGPRGPYPAGVEDLLAHIAGSYAEEAPGVDQWGFLVGGPGNGKSEALRDLARRLGLPEHAPGPAGKAPREISGVVGGTLARLVNDASIPRDDRPAEGSLHRDLAEAFAAAGSGSPVLFFANVNRGVLVGERAPPPVDEPAGLAASCLGWLEESATGLAAADPGTSYYARRKFDTGSREVVVHVLSLDATSLFEAPPGAGAQALDFSGGDEPLVAPYVPFGMVRALPGARAASAASALVAAVSDPAAWLGDGCAGCAAKSLCPFRANARWLADAELRERFLEAGRGAEIAAGRRTTYRDLLGVLATAILGRPEPAWREVHPCDWARSLAASATPSAIGHLAGHRIYAALFPAPAPNARTWRRRGAGRIGAADLYNAVIAQFGADQSAARAAPLDAGFRVVDPASSLDGWEGSREVVLESAEAMHVEGPVGRLVALHRLPSATVCDLDETLDNIVRAALTEQPESRQAARQREPQIRQWRSALLHRHAGLAGGWLGDLAAIQAWLGAQLAALDGSGQSLLHEGLRRLVAPTGVSLKLALFRPRTRSFDGPLPPSTVLVFKASSELSAELRAVKDGLQFILRASTDGRAAASIPVDLDLAREAALLADGAQGFTDLPDQAIARIERVQASLLARVRQARGRLPLHITDDEGRLFAVRPAGPSLMLVPSPMGARS